MTLQHRNSQTTSATGVSTVDITKPTGCAAGDLLILHVGTRSGSRVPSSTGFTDLHAAQTIGAAAASSWTGYRIADGSEGATFTVSWTGGNDEVMVSCSAFYDDAGGTLSLDTASQVDTSGTSHVTPSVTPAGANELAIATFVLDNGGTDTWGTASTGYAEVVDAQTGSTYTAIAVDWKVAGSGSQTATAVSSRSDDACSALAFFIVTPAAGAAPKLLALTGVG